MNEAGERLLDERMLNAVLVVVTSVVGPILTERYARRLADKGETLAPADLRPAAPPDHRGATG